MANKKDQAKDRHRNAELDKPEMGPKPGDEDDGGESILSGHSREKNLAIPEEADLPPDKEGG